MAPKNPEEIEVERERRRQYSAQYRKDGRVNKAKQAEYNAAYRKEHAEELRIAKAEWGKRPESRVRDSIRKKKARDRDPEATKEAARLHMSQWRSANREAARAAVRNRRALERGAEGYHTAADIARIRKAQKDTCAYCPRKLRGKGHVDHIVALSKGGSNWPSNLQLACDACNASKGARDPIVFAQTLGMLL